MHASASCASDVWARACPLVTLTHFDSEISPEAIRIGRKHLTYAIHGCCSCIGSFEFFATRAFAESLQSRNTISMTQLR